jgi:predicted ATPase/DNA-binding XRE family transcriptional regulator
MPASVVNDASASFGERLRDHRRAAGLTQEELAERAGVSPRSISELERGGAHVPRRDTVGLLARALGLSPADRKTFEQLVERQRRARPAGVTLDQSPNGRAAPTPETAEQPRHNVPRLLTSIIGRETELDELASVLPNAPLLTLVGAGGVGKTRLAQELVRQHAASYEDGSWLVELAGLTDAGLMPGAVAAAVGLRDVPASNLMNLLTEYLSSKQLLLVLDNCEHLVAACADLVAQLLRGCPRVSVLVTSREPLAIVGERTWHVLPLDLPQPGQTLSVEQLSRVAAVRLFLERARAVNNALTITEHNAPAIARICVGVDGIPLALELAAARTRMLTVDELAERLDQDAGILRATNRARLPQHRTIRATIDWSHDLLGAHEQMLLRRLAVFACGWTLDLAEEVCSGEGIERARVLDLLGQLVDKSMVMVDARDSVARYRLLEPIRQYALERLEASGEATTYGGRFCAALMQLVQTTEAGRAGPDETFSLDRIELEHDNLRAALAWALSHQRAAAAVRCSAALFRFWERRGHFQEGCTWLEQSLAEAVDAPARDRGWALNALAFLYWRCGDYARAAPIAEQSLTVNREAGMARDVAQALLNLGMIAYFREEATIAVARLEESVHHARQGGLVPQLSVALSFLGRILLWAEGPEHPRAISVLEESLRLAQESESRYAMGHALITQGDLVWRQGDVAHAIPLWRHALVVRSGLADRRGIAGSLERLAWGLASLRQFERAAWLFGASEAQHHVLGIGLRHDEQTDHARLVRVTREHLGEAFLPAWSAGRAATLQAALTRALQVPARLRADSRGQLTARWRASASLTARSG